LSNIKYKSTTQIMPLNWADDASSQASAPDHEPQEVLVDGPDEKTEVMYKVRWVKHPSTYAYILYDLQGTPLLDDHGKPMNIRTVALKEALQQKKVRWHHKPGRPGHGFFTHNKLRQIKLFRDAIEKGLCATPSPLVVYMQMSQA
jgi:hypothetical protein